jgi:ATP adenylyltransferase/5',5'''-P-1,P-4-tetraphosphate phosphorylase II
MTKDWMFMVNRRRPHHNGLTCGTLGYLGLFYAKTDEQKEQFMHVNPIELLTNLSYPVDENDNMTDTH